MVSRGSREKGRERENFRVGLKVRARKLCLPLGSSEPPPLTLHTPPQADPRLSPLWRLGEPVFPVHLCNWREPAAIALEAKPCGSSKAWQEFVS